MTQVDWRLGRHPSAADRTQAALLPEAIHQASIQQASSGGAPGRMRVAQSLATAGRHGVAALTELPAGPLRLRGRGVVVPVPSLQAELARWGPQWAGKVAVLPFPTPDAVFDWDDTRAVVEVNDRYHLEARPRILAAADWARGQGLTRLLPLARDVLHREGELVLLGALAHRDRIAPLVSHLGLAEWVVLLPDPSPREAAGLLHGADALVHAEDGGYPYWLLWAAAAGLPAVALDSPVAREASGRAALMVDPARADAWAAAVSEALTNQRLREVQIERGREAAAPSRLSVVAGKWLQLLRSNWPEPG